MMKLEQYHCFRSGCWCHANNGDWTSNKESYYEKKKRLGLISDDHLDTNDKKAIERDKIITKYTGYAVSIANKYYSKDAVKEIVDLDDLIQEGLLVLVSVADSKHSSSYFYLKIKTAIKNYIKRNSLRAMTGVPHRKYWTYIKDQLNFTESFNFNKQSDISVFNVMSQYPLLLDNKISEDEDGNDITYHDVLQTDLRNPEEFFEYREKLKEIKTKIKKFRGFVKKLTRPERIVLQKIILAKNPDTTRDVAKRLEVSSPQTVSNIKNRVMQKAVDYFQMEGS